MFPQEARTIARGEGLEAGRLGGEVQGGAGHAHC